LGPIDNFVESVQCNFDNGNVCGFTQDTNDEIDFQFNKGRTTTSNTGPSRDHTSGSGQYLFVESSLPTKVGDRAILRTPWFKTSDQFCIRFSYHMYGQFMGAIRLYAYEKRTNTNIGTPNKIWEKFDNQGNKWNNLVKGYTPRKNVQVNSEAYFIYYLYSFMHTKI